jgi:hypothetical protein
MGFRGARRCVYICIGFADTQSPPSSTFVPRHFFSALGGSLHSWDYREVGYVRRFTFPARDGPVRPGLGIQGVAWLGYGLFMQDAYILAHWESSDMWICSPGMDTRHRATYIHSLRDSI